METLQQAVAVGLGEIRISNNPSEILACYGLGSCIGLAAYDPVSKVGGLAHIVLPDSERSRKGRLSAKFADVAVPLLLEEVSKRGAVKSRLEIKMAGGAHMFRLVGTDDSLNIGKRNIARVRELLAREQVGIRGSDVGGNSGRTLWLYVESGRVAVRMVGQQVREL